MVSFMQLVLLKTGLNLRSEAARSYLSYGWWVLEPVLHMTVYYLVFGKLLQRGTEDFVVFLLTGLIPWLWFAKTVPNATGAILNARGLILQVPLTKVFFPLVVVLQDAVKQVVVFSILFGFLLVYGIVPSITWIGIIPLVMVELVFISACAFIAATITPFVPDFRFLVGTGVQLMMFASGVFFSYEILLPEHQFYFFLNPMAVLLANYRDVLVNGIWPDWSALSMVFIGSVIVLLIMISIVNRFSGVFPRLVAE
jgi:lipopolysaccharide transport system permease protein